MKAVFEVKSIESDWKPPFRKVTTTNEYVAGTGEAFDRITGNGNDEPVFEVLEIMGERAKLRYSRLFTIKEPNERCGKDKTVWLVRGLEQPVSYLWGERGITKKVTLKGMASEEQIAVEEQAENLVEGQAETLSENPTPQ